MTLPDFVTGLEMELRLRGEPFDRADLETFAADVWPLAEEDPEPGRWASEFLETTRQPACGFSTKVVQRKAP